MDIETILKNHKKLISKAESLKIEKSKLEDYRLSSAEAFGVKGKSLYSEIPDLFFDDILVNYKLSRVHILVLMYLYRSVWCRPNMSRKFGISPMMSTKQIIDKLAIDIEEYHQAVNHLEKIDFIETIRSGQYFVRKYFSKEFDDIFGQNYDE